jgi:hypothetical protein
MSPSEPRGQVHLHVKAADEGTEIFISDGRFNVVSTGRGTLDADLSPGIYQVKLRAGFATREENVILDGSKPIVPLEYGALRLATAAPLEGAHETSPAQGAFINEQLQKPPAGEGGDSTVFVFVWSAGADRPARGLGLWGADKQVVDLDKHSEKSREGWAACHMRLPHGPYRLSLQLPTGERLEQTVVAPPGWQVRLFLGQRAYGKDPNETRPDLPGVAIFYSQDSGFNPSSEEARLAELARLGLSNHRQVLSDQALNRILAGKFKDPMLGLLGAHLLRAARPEDTKPLQTVVDNLRRLFVNAAHPDVEALALLLEESRPYRFEVPPMLRRSWAIVVKESVTLPEVLAPDGLAARVADRVWGEEPWLLWLLPALPPSVASESFQDAAHPGEPDDFEDALRGHLRRLGKYPGHQKSSPLERIGVAPEAPPRPVLQEEEWRQLVLALGLPRSRVERLLKRVFPQP